jgi:hypothetical protein
MTQPSPPPTSPPTRPPSCRLVTTPRRADLKLALHKATRGTLGLGGAGVVPRSAKEKLRAISPCRRTGAPHRRRQEGERGDHFRRSKSRDSRFAGLPNLPPHDARHQTSADGGQVAASGQGRKDGASGACLSGDPRTRVDEEGVRLRNFSGSYSGFLHPHLRFVSPPSFLDPS